MPFVRVISISSGRFTTGCPVAGAASLAVMATTRDDSSVSVMPSASAPVNVIRAMLRSCAVSTSLPLAGPAPALAVTPFVPNPKVASTGAIAALRSAARLATEPLVAVASAWRLMVSVRVVPPTVSTFIVKVRSSASLPSAGGGVRRDQAHVERRGLRRAEPDRGRFPDDDLDDPGRVGVGGAEDERGLVERRRDGDRARRQTGRDQGRVEQSGDVVLQVDRVVVVRGAVQTGLRQADVHA